jgi:hypothetical protein
MGEARKADSVVWIRRSNGNSMKVELFRGLQFPTEKFDNSLGEEVLLNQRRKYFRVRIDGVWFPSGFKRLFTKTQCSDLIIEAVFE